MAKIKGWEKVKMRGLVSDTWWLSDGVEIESYGIKTKYPFIQVSRYLPDGVNSLYKTRLVTTHQNKILIDGVTKEQAMKKAINYMRANPNG